MTAPERWVGKETERKEQDFRGLLHIHIPACKSILSRYPRSSPFPAYRTYAEYLRHPKFLAVRALVFERAGGICERCGERPATEPHHLAYPPWGTFDVPENIIAICHPCHCRAHGKER